IMRARPTAVNLEWAVRRVLSKVPEGYAAALDEAMAILAQDALVNRAAAENAADFVLQVCPRRPLRVLTHCNTGRLATGAFGTALGTIQVLADRGAIGNVLVGETRPLLQGARLTSWELGEAGIPHTLAVDSAAAWAMRRDQVDCVLVGADRIVANGDVANKIGTYALALAARRHRIPFIVVAPESTRDLALASGRDIAVEQRDADEVRAFMGSPVAPAGTPVFNPAFDITEADLITAVVTEKGVLSLDANLIERILARTVVYPDFPKPGTNFRDLAGLYADPQLFAESVTAISREFNHNVDRVVAIDARGLAVGAALAGELRLPLTLIRKPGKLPGETGSYSYQLEYGTDELHVQKGAIAVGERVVIADDILATGGTMIAAIELLRGQGAAIAGVAVVMSLTGLGGRERLADQRLVSLVEVPA
ncbi:MAG TPA: S-methyl-5-thioribose-1-phosphate isomerase, partial [Acetobacteraceae bacterium]|nr:S-methyl-5-thioribose-1-phosphate isomerase [Acetobacteraceae bacterium]